jgi:hypothetical protein
MGPDQVYFSKKVVDRVKDRFELMILELLPFGDFTKSTN